MRRIALNSLAVRGKVVILPEWFMFVFKQYHCVLFVCHNRVRRYATYCPQHRSQRRYE